MIIRWEQLIVLLNEGLKTLVQKHWDEAGIPRCSLNVDWPRYGLLEREEVIRWIGIRENKKLIGYASVCITHPLHHMDDKTGMLDTIFLSKEHRKGIAGARIIDAIESLLIEQGVNVYVAMEREHVSRSRGGLGKILKRKGFTKYECGWIKHIGA